MSDLNNDISKDDQTARAFMRETFLRTILLLNGRKCTINTFEMNKVDGVFKGSDIDFQELLFDDLKTPYSIVPHSIVRANDVLFLEFPEQMETS